MQFLTIHYKKAMQEKQFSIIRANIEATEEKKKKALELYPEPEYLHELHQVKKNITIKI